MPTILVKIPCGAFPADHQPGLIQRITDAAAAAEHIPQDPKKRFVTWVALEEIDAGKMACAGADMTAQVIPCIVVAYVPAGVLDDAARASYVRLVHAALQDSLPPGEMNTARLYRTP